MKINYYLIILSIVCSSLYLVSCQKQLQTKATESVLNNAATLRDAPITHDIKFKVVKVMYEIDAFNALGFEFGDSVDAVFNTGYKLQDIPYYNGFYVETGAPMIVGYPGRTYLYLGYNDSEDVWDLGKLDEHSTVTVTLRTRGKYRSVQETFQLVYSDDRNDFASDIEFANYRAMSGGRMKKNIFYRSASPCDNQHNRAPYVDSLIKSDNIQYIINFSDNEESVKRHLSAPNYNSPYFKKLYEENRVALLDLSSNYRLPAFKQAVARSLSNLLNYDGPYLAHCVEGKDRTGFISILMEGLCGATYEEMKSDYMKTYEIYYGVSQTNRPESYEAISKLLYDAMVGYLANTKDLNIIKQTNYINFVKQYLLDGGMSLEEINLLSNKICNSSD